MAKRRKINPKKLNMLLESKGLTKQGVSMEMGFSRTAFGNSIGEGLLSEPIIKLLDMMYGIPFELYGDEEPEVHVIEAAPDPVRHELELTISEETANKIYQTVYAAVFAAVKEAFK